VSDVITIRAVLAPTDFSHHAERAVRFACELAEKFGATLHLLHVLPEVIAPVGPDPSLVTALPAEYYQDAEQDSLKALSKVVDSTWSCPAKVETAVLWGDAVDGITSYAKDHAIDMIVVATHGRTGLSHVLLGSVAERIVRESTCPVLSIRDRQKG
jgi:nucleotide-binding universal stress UspA family protein